MKKITLSLVLPIFLSLNTYAQDAKTDKKKEEVKKLTSRDGGNTKISFVGSGDMQKSLSSGTDLAANTGIGVIFERKWDGSARWFKDFKFDFAIHVASNVDTIKADYNTAGLNNTRDFGTYIMLPMNSGQATRFKLNAYFGEKKWMKKVSGVVNGLYGEFVSSNRVWSDSTQSRYATGMLGKIGFFHDFVPNSIRLEKDYSITVGVCWSFRGIFGDTGFRDETSNNFRKNILGTDARQFNGYEINLGFKLKNIEAQVSVPTLFGNTGGSVPGLSETQFITSIRFIGGFPISLDSK